MTIIKLFFLINTILSYITINISPILLNVFNIREIGFDTTSSKVINYQNKKCEIILFTTAVGNNKTLSIIKIVSDWYSLLQSLYPICFIIYSSSPIIIDILRDQFTIITKFKTNNYSLPILPYLFNDVSSYFNAEYYGFINFDIIISSNIYNITREIRKFVYDGLLPTEHELAGRVSVRKTELFPTTISDINQMKPLLIKHDLRNAYSADYFIFSKESLKYFKNSRHNIVVARRHVDNYLLGIGYSKDNFFLIDSTYVMPAVHIGIDTHDSANSFVNMEDKRWNMDLIRNKKLMWGSILCNNTIRLKITDNNLTYEVIKGQTYRC